MFYQDHSHLSVTSSSCHDQWSLLLFILVVNVSSGLNKIKDYFFVVPVGSHTKCRIFPVRFCKLYMGTMSNMKLDNGTIVWTCVLAEWNGKPYVLVEVVSNHKKAGRQRAM